MQNTKEFYDAFSAAITKQADPFHMPVIAPPPSAEAPQPQASAFDVETMEAVAQAGKDFKARGGLKGASERNKARVARVGAALDRAGSSIAEKAADAWTSVAGTSAQEVAAPVSEAVITPVTSAAARTASTKPADGALDPLLLRRADGGKAGAQSKGMSEEEVMRRFAEEFHAAAR